MKVGVMLRHFGQPGGIGVYTNNILHALFKIDQRNQYLLMFGRLEQLGHFDSYPNVNEQVVRAPNKLWWDQVAVPRLARKEQLDIVYNPKLSVPLFGGYKKILVMHGSEQFAIPHAFKWHDRLYFSIANPIYCKKAESIIISTHSGAADVSRYMDAEPAKIEVINFSYNESCQIIEEDLKEEIRSKYGLPEHFILFLGGLNPLKNLSNLVRAYHKIRDSIPQKLIITGFRRWKFSADLDLIAKLELSEDIQWTGYIPDEDIPALYNLADLFVFPSLYEGFGMPVLEAMACGCPVVATNAGCTPEVAGDAARLVDPYSPQEIAAGIQEVLGDEELYQRLVTKGLERAQQFSWARCAQETLALFESL